ncbi:hypothetical protein, partial [Campylobacter concisus]|uniref:hypothetical protein n=1 Tax=Campylobacter concisus TaxID=199 RepID=UPI001C5B443B
GSEHIYSKETSDVYEGQFVLSLKVVKLTGYNPQFSHCLISGHEKSLLRLGRTKWLCFTDISVPRRSGMTGNAHFCVKKISNEIDKETGEIPEQAE